MLSDLSIDTKKTVQKLIIFIRDTVHNAGFSRVIIGLSGGIDSATSVLLAVRSLGSENVYPALLPYGKFQTQSVADAWSVIRTGNISSQQVTEINIQKPVDHIAREDASIGQLRKGNIMVRIRMIYLFDLSKRYSALVLGTENRTEYLLGYYTRFGDEASDLEPIRNLYKTQVKQLATYLGVPENITVKAPTAGLWEGQTDENEFGFSYEDADQILHLFIDLKKTRREIISLGFSPGTIDKVIARLKTNDYKHQLPYFPVDHLT